MKKHRHVAFILVLSLIFSIMNSLIVQPVSAALEKRMRLPFSTSWEDEPDQTYGKETSVDCKKDFSSPYLNDVDNQVHPPSPEIFGFGFGLRQRKAAGRFDSLNSYCYFNLFDMTPECDARRKPPGETEIFADNEVFEE